MPDIVKQIPPFQFQTDALDQDFLAATAGFYIPHEPHQKAKKEGRAFSVFRARLRLKQTWLNKGENPIALGNQFNFDYLDRNGQWVKLGDVNFHPLNEQTHDQDYDITNAFGQGNFGVNLIRWTYFRYDHPGQINKFKVELTVTVTYGS